MYVDRYRFSNEPQQLKLQQEGSFRNLLRNPRSKAWAAREIMRNIVSVRRAYSSLENRESRHLFVDLLKYRLLGPHFTAVANNKQMFDTLEEAMSAQIPSEEVPIRMEGELAEVVRLWSVKYNDKPLELISSKYALYWMLRSDQY